MTSEQTQKNLLRLKELIRATIKEMSTTSGVAGVSTPNAFGKVKDPTTGITGYEKVETCLDEKKKSDDDKEAKPEKRDSKATDSKKASPARVGHDAPMIAPEKSDDMELVKRALKLATDKLGRIEKAKKSPFTKK